MIIANNDKKRKARDNIFRNYSLSILNHIELQLHHEYH